MARAVTLSARRSHESGEGALRRFLRQLDQSGLLPRVPSFFKGGFGGGLEPTQENCKSLE